jgi:hypothetical protein
MALIEHHADPNEISDTNESPLLLTLKFDLLHYADYLFENGADPALNVKGQNMLSHAAEMGNLDFVTWLVDRCLQNIDTPETSPPILRSIDSGNFTITSFFLRRGANPNIRMSDGASFLEWALEHNDIRLSQMLVHLGADIETVDPEKLPDDFQQFAASKTGHEPTDADDSIEKIATRASEVAAFVTDTIKPLASQEKVKPTHLSGSFNNIRDCCRDFIVVISDLKKIRQRILEEREVMLAFQYQKFQKTDLRGILSCYDDDAEMWRKVLEKFDREIASTEGIELRFASICRQEIAVQLAGLETRKKFIFAPFDEVPFAEGPPRRILIMKMNRSLERIRILFPEIQKTFNELAKFVAAYLEKVFAGFALYEKAMARFTSEPEKVARLAFPENVLSELVQRNQERANLLASSKNDMEAEKGRLEKLFSEMQKRLEEIVPEPTLRLE